MSLLEKTLKGRVRPPKGGISSKGSMGNSTADPWTVYFDQEHYHDLKSGRFHVYSKGKYGAGAGPALILLHGGGYSALTWALFAQELNDLGPGSCQQLAIDLRGHGLTYSYDDDMLDLDTLCRDVVDVVRAHFPDEVPACAVVGHSMGGAIAVQVSYALKECVALCVIDVVEGTAMDSLCAMQKILKNRPASFASVIQAIHWAYKSGQTHNILAAKVSMPGQIKNSKTGIVASLEISETAPQYDRGAQELMPRLPSSEVIMEEGEDQEDAPADVFAVPSPVKGASDSCSSSPSSSSSSSPPASAAADSPRYNWRIDLTRTERFWAGWFGGLSNRFLAAPVPKLLILANINGLDTTLTVGQMQGKFQLVVLPKSGHAIHEDLPGRVAETVLSFLVKQQVVAAPATFHASMTPGC